MEPQPGGLVPYPSPKSRCYGGHAIVAAGYDDDLTVGGDKGALLIRNSWGTGWGDGGYGWMSYRYVTEGLGLDWWTVIDQKWVDTGQF
jgi:C1A family cysteine protease